MPRTAPLAAGAVALFALTVPSFATEVTYLINANGAAEVSPNVGDPDGTAIGTLKLDNGTGSGSTGSATLNLSLSLINGTGTGHHIHNAAAGANGSIVVDFGNPTTILTGSPSSGTLSGTITGLNAVTITSIFNTPQNFYYNFHTSPDFPGGAVRSQLPEPASLSLLALAGAGLFRARRRPPGERACLS